ncbi:MAG: ParA family protein [Candidatus Dactylopiibacterium sp.]|nr:ParA family protein [Candidatus Dactylopiibacterium sp.]
MQVYLVANPKGGSGKSTLATNLAGLLAWKGEAGGVSRVMLGDIDRQQSSRFWIERRPPELPRIEAWEAADGKRLKAPRGTTHAVLDSPAGLHGDRLKEALKLAQRVLVPVQPSVFDIFATQAFFEELAGMKAARGLDVGLVGMRMNERSRASDEFERYIETTGLPLVGRLRNTQNYVHLAAQGLTLFDVTPSRVAADLEQWASIDAWLAIEPLPPGLD